MLYLLWQKLKKIIPFLSRNFTRSMMYGRLYVPKMQQANDFLFYLPKFIIRFYKTIIQFYWEKIIAFMKNLWVKVFTKMKYM